MRHVSVVSRYAIPTGISQIDSWSTGPLGFETSQITFFLGSIFMEINLYDLLNIILRSLISL